MSYVWQTEPRLPGNGELSYLNIKVLILFWNLDRLINRLKGKGLNQELSTTGLTYLLRFPKFLFFVYHYDQNYVLVTYELVSLFFYYEYSANLADMS